MADTPFGVGFRIEIDNVNADMVNLVFEKDTRETHYRLSDMDFFNKRYIRVTPYDELGDGLSMLISHHYTPPAVDNPVTVPVTSETSVPDIIAEEGYEADYTGIKRKIYGY